jgi:hypothetical protein
MKDGCPLARNKPKKTSRVNGSGAPALPEAESNPLPEEEASPLPEAESNPLPEAEASPLLEAIAGPAPKNEYLLRYIDFFYSSITALVVKLVYEKFTHIKGSVFFIKGGVSFDNLLNIIGFIYTAIAVHQNGVASLVLLLGVFYFVLDDWLDSRNFNAKVGYHGFFRFFIDVIIGFLSYGALFFAFKRSPVFILFILFIHICVILWLFKLRKECKENDLTKYLFREDTLPYINVYIATSVASIFLCIYALFFYRQRNQIDLSLDDALMLVLFGFIHLALGDFFRYKFAPNDYLESFSPGAPLLNIRTFTYIEEKVIILLLFFVSLIRKADNFAKSLINSK